MAIEILGLLAASAGASYGWWKLQQQRDRRLRLRPPLFAPDLDVAIAVARHEAQARHQSVGLLHLLYGILQDEDFTAAITRLGGDPEAMESYVQAELERGTAGNAREETMQAFSIAASQANAQQRLMAIKDLWVRIARMDTTRAMAAAGKIDSMALLFLLVHGMPEPSTDLPDRVDVHVVLRNDDFTTMEMVVAILRDQFGLSEQDAMTRMRETHEGGRTVVGRFKLAAAKEKIALARARAKERGFPLWIGVEDC